jgi:PIN domain nuclease of toxin-antitoxin system
LSDKALQAIEQAESVFFSPVNLWEIGIKSSIESDYNISSVTDIYTACLKANLEEMMINSADTMAATQLPMIHRDPFDRLLIAQAQNQHCYLLTVDSKIAQYQLPYLMIV